MASYRDFLQQVGEKASQLRQNASSPNGKLKAEIRRISAKGGPDSLNADARRGADILSTILKRDGENRFLETVRGLVEEAEKIEKELPSISEKIDAVVAEAYLSIRRDCLLPEDFYNNFMELSSRWQSLNERLEGIRSRLLETQNDVEKAAALCESLQGRLLEEPGPEQPKYPSKRYDKEYFSSFDLESLNKLRFLLRGMVNLFVMKTARSRGLTVYAARHVASKLLSTLTFFLAYPEERKRAKMLKAELERCRTKPNGRNAPEHTSLFSRALQLHSVVCMAMPPGLVQNETAVFRKLSDFDSHLHDTRESHIDRDAKIKILRSGVERLVNYYMSADVDLTPAKRFLLELAPAKLENFGFDIDTDDPEGQVHGEEKMFYLSVYASLLEGAIFGHEEVRELLELFGLDNELMSLIHPFNFVLEHDAVRQLVDPPVSFCNIQSPLLVSRPHRNYHNIGAYFDLHPLELTLLPSHNLVFRSIGITTRPEPIYLFDYLNEKVVARWVG